MGRRRLQDQSDHSDTDASGDKTEITRAMVERARRREVKDKMNKILTRVPSRLYKRTTSRVVQSTALSAISTYICELERDLAKATSNVNYPRDYTEHEGFRHGFDKCSNLVLTYVENSTASPAIHAQLIGFLSAFTEFHADMRTVSQQSIKDIDLCVDSYAGQCQHISDEDGDYSSDEEDIDLNKLLE